MAFDIPSNALPVLFGLAGACLVLLFLEGFRFTTRRQHAKVQANDPLIVHLPRLPYIGSPGFFTKSYGFLRESRELCKGLWFKFGVRNNTVLAIFGEDARAYFFNSRNMHQGAGLALISPAIDQFGPDGWEEKKSFAWFIRHLTRTDIIEPCLAHILSDIDREMTSWVQRGAAIPFKDLSRLFLQISSRLAVGNEVADDPVRIARIIKSLQAIEEASTPDHLILPWIPTPARVRMMFAGVTLYRIFSTIIRSRKQRGSTEKDVLQSILDEGDPKIMDDRYITQLLATTIFASGSSTGKVLPWMYIFLDRHPTWKSKVRAEVDAFVKLHSSATSTSLAKDLVDLPLATWEASLPNLDMCMHETIRMVALGALPRKNLGPDVKIGERTIRKNDYVLYMTEDIHMDPTIYPDPRSFNPARSRDIPVKLGFVGWGGGNHVCTGQRIAKAMAKIITVLMFSRLTYRATKLDGSPLTETPSPEVKLWSIGFPADPIHFKVKAREADD